MLNPIVINHDDRLIQTKSNVTDQPDFSNYPIRGIPWEVIIHADYRMSLQQISFLGSHMQLIETEVTKDTTVRFAVTVPTVFVVVMIEGFVKFYRECTLVSYAMGGVMYMTYNPCTEFTFNVGRGKHTMMVVSLNSDWFIMVRRPYPKFSHILNCLREQRQDTVILPMCRLDEQITALWDHIRVADSNPFIYRADLVMYASRLADFYHRQIESGNIIKSQLSTVTANRIFAYVEANYTIDNGISVVKLAEHTGLTKYKVDEYTRFLFGKTLHKYVRGLRMTKAAQFLRSTKQSIPEIALKVGYSNLPHFYEVFQRYFGMSPLLYRKKENDKR